MDAKNKVSTEAMDTALQELEAMEKSLTDGKGTDEVADLIKALDAEADALIKGHEEPDGDEDEKGKEPVGAEEDDKEKEEMEKAIIESNREELIKASDAYEALEKSVSVGMDDLREQVGTLTASVNALLGLNVTAAKVIGALTKSVQEQQESLNKSLKEIGAAPVGTSKTTLGIGSHDSELPLEKSRGEIQELLTKAVQEKKVDARWLSIYGVKGINGLTEDIKQIIGV